MVLTVDHRCDSHMGAMLAYWLIPIPPQGANQLLAADIAG